MLVFNTLGDLVFHIVNLYNNKKQPCDINEIIGSFQPLIYKSCDMDNKYPFIKETSKIISSGADIKRFYKDGIIIFGQEYRISNQWGYNGQGKKEIDNLIKYAENELGEIIIYSKLGTKKMRKQKHMGTQGVSNKIAVLTSQMLCDNTTIEGEYTPPHFSQKHISVKKLKDDLFQLINVSDGIRKQANDMTHKDSNPEYVELVLKRKKSQTTSWFNKKVCDFVNDVNKKANNYFAELIYLIQDSIKNELINGSSKSDSKNRISFLLHAIIGYFSVTLKDINICQRAEMLLKELEKANVTMPLLGEYIDHMLEKNNNYDSDWERSQIILYLDNICDESIDMHSFIENISSTLSHEYFHFHHYFSIWEANDLSKGCQLSLQYEKELNSYYPGTVVKESLADYFECEHQSAHNRITNKRSIWNSNDWHSWPYSGAKYITCHAHFREIFLTSLHSFSKAMKVLGL